MGSESWDANVTGLGPRDVPRSKEGRREGEWGGDNRGKNIIKYMYRKTLYKFYGIQYHAHTQETC